MQLSGPRLLLRPWRDSDLDPLFAINGDPGAMRYFQAPMTRAESDAWAARMRDHMDRQAWGFWVVEWPGVAEMVGVVGLLTVGFEAWFAPAVEIGWRIHPRFQRQGLAEEAARLSLDAGFRRLGLDRIVAFTVPANEPSWRLMEKLGMGKLGEFEHPRLPEGHRYRPQVVYGIGRETWITAGTTA